MGDINDNKPALPEAPGGNEKVKEVNKKEQQKSDPQITELNNFFRPQDDLEPKEKDDESSKGRS